MPRRGVLIALLSVLALAGCGSDSPSVPTGPAGPAAKAPISGSSSADMKIARELRSYMARNCPASATKLSEPQIPARLRSAPGYQRLRAQYLAVAHGTVTLCRSVKGIGVDGKVITLATGLDSGATGRAGADAACTLIQGSDVADFTAGHTILDRDGNTIETCRTRSG